MDFFTAQDHARRNTGRLVLFFLLAVLSLIVLTNLLVMMVLGYLHAGAFHPDSPSPFDWRIFLYIGCGVILVVTGGTLYKISALSGGGDAVAAMFGAQPIFADNEDLDNQKLVHIVEEMAIASGTPVPQVYLLNESGINAFAAGFSTNDAIIAVTRGAVRNLNREQLQGVVAHEFSHILNGDMRLNIRLIGILHGILLIGLIGYQILRGSGRARKGSGGALVLGLGLIIIGYAGTFFGNLIKSAVSRQREFLADAAAVQFTRNPQGIGGALLSIGASQDGSLVRNPKSSEISHAFFSQGVTVSFKALFATHPPLAERIGRILPDWDGRFPTGALSERTGKAGSAAAVKPPPAAAGLTGGALMDQIGRTTNAHLLQARQLLRDIPEKLQKAARDPFAARALLFCLVLDPDEIIRTKQLRELKSTADRGVGTETLRLIQVTSSLRREQKLPLIELALPTLRRLSEAQSKVFLQNLDSLIRADGKFTFFEWCLREIVVQYLDDYFGKPAKTREKIGDPGQVSEECGVLLSTLVNATRHAGLKADEILSSAAEVLGQKQIMLIPPSQLGLLKLDRSLKVLRHLKPKAKEQLVKACVTCVTADGRIEPVEAEMMRAVAAALQVPMPPLV